jgi:hypothetical protein
VAFRLYALLSELEFHKKRRFLSKIVKELNLLHSIFFANTYLTDQGTDNNNPWYTDLIDEASGIWENNKDKNKEL